jgi:type IV pilus assembly protein PilB
MIDEVSVVLKMPIKVTVGAPSAISRSSKEREPQRVLDSASEGCSCRSSRDKNDDESITVERLTSDISPIIRLVDSTIYTAIQRRGATSTSRRPNAVTSSPHRRRAAAGHAAVAKQHHSAIISRIKVMAELILSPARAAGRPLQGAAAGKTIDFRVSIAAERARRGRVIRISTRNRSAQFTELRLDILGFPEQG